MVDYEFNDIRFAAGNAACESRDLGHDSSAEAFSAISKAMECDLSAEDDGRVMHHIESLDHLAIAVQRYVTAWDAGNSSHEDPNGWREMIRLIEKDVLFFVLKDPLRTYRILEPLKSRRALG